MNKNYKVAIIGGGSAGIFAAIELTRVNGFKPGEVVILEKNDRIGKKLLATGNGQGNLTNKNISEDNFYGEKEFVIKATKTVINADLPEYFYSISMPILFDKEGRGYPVSKQASAVLDILRERLFYCGVEVLTEFNVQKIQRVKDGYIISSLDSEVFAKYVIAAFGGKAGKNFGTDGTAYSLLAPFNHKVTPLFPSLVQLKTEKEKIKGLSGLKEKAKVFAYDGEKCLGETVGDLLFTDYGVSGNTIFYLSAKLTDKKSPKIKVEFLPDYSMAETEKLLNDKLKNSPFIKREDYLLGLLNKKIGERIIKNSNANTVKEIAYAIKNYYISVTGNTGFNYAQVTKGGIETSGIDEITYESKYAKNLFIVGEALNVDGDCGGYNLSFAISSALSSAREIKKRENIDNI